MRASGPTTRSAHAFTHFIKPDNDTMIARFIFLRGGYPTDPLIARERCDVRPHKLHLRVSLNSLTKICGEFMGNMLSNVIFCHYS